MAQLISVRLQRNDGSPWGFRLQGGKDFGTPLVIQKVNGNSIAERAGLQAGDAVLRVNSSDVFNLRHKDAQDTIVHAGQSFEITIQRGQTTWKPNVAPTGNLPQPSAVANNVSPVTKTSLAANKPASAPIGTGHNVAAKPFLNGNSDMKLVNKQYNSPVGLYSEESIAETLSAQTEVLSTGVLGVNFKKNEKTYNAANSEVLKMLQEAENDPREPEPVSARSEFYSHASHAIGGRAKSPRPLTPLAQQLGHVKYEPQISALSPPPSHRPSLPITQETPTCSECERVIVGVFVRIKDKNLHVECFKCSTCGTSLKNVGYYNINNKLYCDIHAKLAARSNPPAPNMVPITIAPGTKAPVGAISAALASHALPSTGPVSPASNCSGPAPYSHSNIDSVDSALAQSKSKSCDNLVSLPPLNADNLSAVLAQGLMLQTAENVQHIPAKNKKTFISEAKIAINNNHLDKEDLNQVQFNVSVKNDTNKPGSSILSGPRPFGGSAPLSPMSSVSAPNSNYAATLPRTSGPGAQPVNVDVVVSEQIITADSDICDINVEQNMEKLRRTPVTWPPIKQEEELPTATPLYIPPSPSNPVLVKCTSSSVNQSQEKLYTSESYVTYNEFSETNQSLEETSQSINEENISTTATGESNFVESISAQLNTQWRPVAGPEISKDEEVEKEESINRSHLKPKMSICSAEVTNITSNRTARECAESIAESIDTQILVENIKEKCERPPSPPPGAENLHRRESTVRRASLAAEATQNLAENAPPPPSKQTIVEKDDKIVSEIQNFVKQVDDVQKQLEVVAKQVDSVHKQLESVQVEDSMKSVTSHKQEEIVSEKHIEMSSITQNQISTESSSTVLEQELTCDISESNLTKTSQKVNIRSNEEELKLPQTQPLVCPQIFHKVEVCQQMCPQVCPQVCPQICPQVCAKVLPSRSIQASSKPMSSTEMHMSAQSTQQMSSSEQYSSLSAVSQICASNTEIGESHIPNAVPKQWKSPFVSALTTASRTPFTSLVSESSSDANPATSIDESGTSFPHPQANGPPTYLASALTIAPSRPFTPVAPLSTEHIPLPEETVPYFPPEIPIKVQPREPEKFDPKTPMLDALTTAPHRSFTPINREVISQEDELMKDLPQPPYGDVSLLSALTTAPERPFTPVWGGSAVLNVPAPPPLPDAPAPPTIPRANLKVTPPERPSVFTPVVTKFVADSIQKPPTTSAQASITKSFPPVSNDLKTAFEPVTEFGASKILQATQQQQMPKVKQHYASVQSSESYEQMSSISQEISNITCSSQGDTITLLSKENCSQKTKPAPPQQLEAKSAPVQHFEAKCDSVSQQILLHKPSSIPFYQRHLSPLGTPKRATTPLPQAETSEHLEAVAHEFTKQLVTEAQQKTKQQTIVTPAWKPQDSYSESVFKPLPATVPIPTVSITETVNPQHQQRLLQTVQPGQNHAPAPQMTFQPVSDDPPRPVTPSSRPARAVTPSLINNPAPIIPYYQTNLIATEHLAPETNLYDPKSPDISRSPTPRFDRSKSPSLRSKSPINRSRSPIPTGPPPSPLKVQAPRIKGDIAASLCGKNTDRVSLVKNQISNFSGQTNKKQVKFQDQSSCVNARGGKTLTTSEFSENIKAETANLRAAATSEQNTMQISADNLIQVQRKKIVKEEFEHTRKKIDIERASQSTTTSIRGFDSGKIAPTTPQSPIIQVQSARGLKTYETSSGKPVPISDLHKGAFPEIKPAKNVSFAAAPTNDEGSLIKPRPVSGIPTPFAAVPGGFQPRPISAFSAVPQKPTSSIPVAVAPRSGNACPSKVAQIPVPTCSASSVPPTNVPLPNAGAVPAAPIGGGNRVGGANTAPGTKGKQAAAVGIAPRRGRGILNKASAPGARIALCGHCNGQISLSNKNSGVLNGNAIPKNPASVISKAIINNKITPTPEQKLWSPKAYKPVERLSNDTINGGFHTSELNCYPSQKSFTLPSAKGPNGAPNGMVERNSIASNNTNDNVANVITNTKPLPTHGSDVGNAVAVPWKCNSSYATLGLVDGVYPVCIECKEEIRRGPFITALGKIWCPEHFVCATPSCRRPLQDVGFVEERGQLYCEHCFEQYLAPTCDQCRSKIKGDCLNAIGKHFHPECFNCSYCGKLFGNSPFFLEDGLPYCEADWNELFTTKCFACGFPVEAGDRWVEALNNNYHSQCFNCTMCKKNLEGQSFYAKGGRPFCKNHAR